MEIATTQSDGYNPITGGGGMLGGQHGHHGTGSGAPIAGSTGMGAATGGQYGAQGSDSFGNPQAPVSGGAVYNADGQSVGTGSGAGIGSTAGAGHHSHSHGSGTGMGSGMGSGTGQHGSGMGTDSSNNSSGELVLSAVVGDISLAWLRVIPVVSLPVVHAVHACSMGSVGGWPSLSFCHVFFVSITFLLSALLTLCDASY